MPERKAAMGLVPLRLQEQSVYGYVCVCRWLCLCAKMCMHACICVHTVYVLYLKACVLFISVLPAVFDSVLDLPPR